MAELTSTVAALESGVEAGSHVGAQLHASLDGAKVADLAIGLARPDVAMSPDTLMPWFSCTKAVTWLALEPAAHEAYGERMGVMYDTTAAPRPIRGMAGHDAYVNCVASGSGVGPISELARLYAVLVAGGHPLLRPQTVEAMTARHRT